MSVIPGSMVDAIDQATANALPVAGASILMTFSGVNGAPIHI
jgi:hypothetical protein